MDRIFLKVIQMLFLLRGTQLVIVGAEGTPCMSYLGRNQACITRAGVVRLSHTQNMFLDRFVGNAETVTELQSSPCVELSCALVTVTIHGGWFNFRACWTVWQLLMEGPSVICWEKHDLLTGWDFTSGRGVVFTLLSKEIKRCKHNHTSTEPPESYFPFTPFALRCLPNVN